MKDKGGQRRDTGAVWGTGIGRKRPRPDRRAVAGSVLFHVVVLAAIAFSGLSRSRTPDFEVYRVQLRSPPPQVAQAEEAPPEVVPEPVVAQPRPVERPQPREPEPPQPRPPERTPETPPEKPPEAPPPEPEPTRGEEPEPDSPGGENLDVNMDGREFPFPDYLENIIRQLHRHFRWSGSPSLEAEVAFFINRDGTVGGIRITRKSGDFNFDMEAMSAVEQVGRRDLFGSLPDGWVDDRLWVRFKFLPPG
jgi:protein TonB